MKKLVAIILFSISFAGFAQRITGVKTLLVGTAVDIRFTIAKGTACNGYNILHSLDSANFTQIYHYPGVCGNTSTDENINFLHTATTLNVFNYYKIDLVPIETSAVQRIFVPEIPTASAMVYPNPLVTKTDQLNFRLFNSNNIKLTGFIYNEKGVSLKTLDLKTNGDIASIGVSDLNNGIYLLSLSDGEKNYSLKFIINR